jgi:alpha-D-xyloside xylohydrolase
MELRMRLVPYLHAAFVRYHRTGVPPFRALVMDYPDDSATWTIDDQYLVGESLLAAPLVGGQASRGVYLPAGEWHDYWSGRRHSGKQRISVSPPVEQIPLFVKSGTILPLAEPTLHTDDPSSWRVSAQVYGDRPAPAVLYEDDGSWAPALAEVTLSWDPAARSGAVRRSGGGAGPRYEVTGWKEIV